MLTEIKEMPGKEAIYKDNERIQKVRITQLEENENSIFLLLEPVDDIFARENDDEEWEYQSGAHLKTAFRFGGEKSGGISLRNGVLAVPFCGSLNVNDYAVERFSNRESDFYHLWYNHPKEEN